ncbi:MAG: hypothetical protein K2R98_19500 [Gemmataceae bacterium]|nr:hypothetical protein [Gemmataceae bacterium]
MRVVDRYGRTKSVTDTMPQVTTKGDLLTYSTGQDRLPVGTDLYGLFADSNQASGLRWGIPYLGMKNAVINGSMNIWQRGTSFAAIASSTYFADRWFYSKSGLMVHTVSRSTDVPTLAQADILANYSILVDCTTVDASIGSTDHCEIGTVIEGYNWANFAQRQITISFWVKATKTGTYCVALLNGGTDQTYVGEYTVNVTATWEKKTVVVTASPSSGTWNYTNTAGLYLYFALACGSNNQTTAGAWDGVAALGTANQVNACDNTANDFRLALVQLEVGDTATSFEPRSFQEELAMCQRYYQKTFPYATAPAQNAGVTGALSLTTSSGTAANNGLSWQLGVPMRATPAITTYNPSAAAASWRDTTGGNNRNATTIDISEQVVGLTFSANPTSGNLHRIHVTADAEL